MDTIPTTVGRGVTFTQQLIDEQFRHGTGIVMANMDNDGDHDIVTSTFNYSDTNDQISWWRNQ